MDLMQAFQQVCGDFPQFRAQIVQARDLTQDSGVRAQLDQVLKSMDESFAEFKQTFPRAAEDVKQTLAKAEQKANEASQMLAAAEQKRVEVAEAAASAAAAVPAVAVPAAKPDGFDLKLAALLRQELLERFAGWRKGPKGTVRVDREIWEDWDEH
jgi:hypothetical protein